VGSALENGGDMKKILLRAQEEKKFDGMGRSRSPFTRLDEDRAAGLL